MTADVRKTMLFVENTLVEGGKPAPRPLRMVAAVAVLPNPWVGRGFVEDLQPDILRLAPVLGDLLVPACIDAAGGAAAIEAYGKAAVVGTMGEVEHASALIHTLHFGNILRSAAQGTSFLPFTNVRAGAGFPLSIPMKHKVEERQGSRSHFLSMTVSIADAPAPDEIVVAIAVATGGRPHHRIGDRYGDMAAMGVDQASRPLASQEV